MNDKKALIVPVILLIATSVLNITTHTNMALWQGHF